MADRETTANAGLSFHTGKRDGVADREMTVNAGLFFHTGKRDGVAYREMTVNNGLFFHTGKRKDSECWSLFFTLERETVWQTEK